MIAALDLTQEDAIWIADQYTPDGAHGELALNAASIVIEFERQRFRGRFNPTATLPVLVSRTDAEELAAKFKIGGPARDLALKAWALTLTFRRGDDVPRFASADPSDDHKYDKYKHALPS